MTPFILGEYVGNSTVDPIITNFKGLKQSLHSNENWLFRNYKFLDKSKFIHYVH